MDDTTRGHAASLELDPNTHRKADKRAAPDFDLEAKKWAETKGVIWPPPPPALPIELGECACPAAPLREGPECADLLHADSVLGYQDGVPVRTLKDLDLMSETDEIFVVGATRLGEGFDLALLEKVIPPAYVGEALCQDYVEVLKARAIRVDEALRAKYPNITIRSLTHFWCSENTLDLLGLRLHPPDSRREEFDVAFELIKDWIGRYCIFVTASEAEGRDAAGTLADATNPRRPKSFTRRAEFFKRWFRELGWTPNTPKIWGSEGNGPDPKTVRKILNGASVNPASLRTLVDCINAGLRNLGRELETLKMQDVPDE